MKRQEFKQEQEERETRWKEQIKEMNLSASLPFSL